MSVTSVLKKTGKWLLRIFVVIILLILLIWGLLQTQWGKNVVKAQAVRYLKKKLKTEVAIQSFTVDWFNHLKLTGIYLEDQHKKKLGYIGLLETRYDLRNIFSGSLIISEISADSIQLNISRQRNDSLFNFSFITSAFASGEKNAATTSKPFRLALGKINLAHLQFLMNDLYGGQVYHFSLASLRSNITQLDLETMKVDAAYFFTDSINTNINLFSTTVNNNKIETVSDTVTAPLSISADTINLANTIFSVQNPETLLDIKTNVASLSAGKIIYNQQLFNFTAATVSLQHHTTSIKIKSIPTGKKIDSSIAVTTGKPFTFFIGKATIDNNNFSFDDAAAAPIKTTTAIDFNHLDMRRIALHADSIRYSATGYAATIRELLMEEKSGFKLKQLKSHVSYSDTSISLNNFVVKTNNNLLQGDAVISYQSLDKIMTAPAKTKLTATVSNSTLQLNDLLYFNPALKNNASFRPLTGKVFLLNTKVSGTLEKLSVPNVSIKQAGLMLLASAEVFHPTDIKKFQVDLKLKQFSGTRKELLSLLPPKTIPDSFLQYIPSSFALKGIFKGGINQFYTDVNLTTSEGNITVKGTAKNIADTKAAVYDLNIAGTDIKLGRLLKDSSMDRFTGTLKIKGKGVDPATADMAYNAHIKTFDYNGYRYNNIDATGTMKQNIVDANIHSTDSNLLITSTTSIDLSKKGQYLKTNTLIENANLLKLGFMKDTLVVKGKIVSDLELKETGKLNGTATITSAAIYFDQKNHFFDTVQLNAKDSVTKQELELISPFANATLKGEYNLKDIPSAIKTIVNKYYHSSATDTLYTKRVIARLNVDVHHPDSIREFIPGLKSVTPFKIMSRLDTDSSILGFISIIPKAAYQDYVIDSVILYAVNVPTREEFKNMTYAFGFKKLTAPSFVIPGFSLAGNIVKGVAVGKVELSDSSGKPRYIIPYSLVGDTIRPRLHLGDTLTINKQKWLSNPSNVIYLNMDELKGTQFTLSNGEELLVVSTDTLNNSGLPLNLTLNNFKLRNIADIAISDTSLVDGAANGNVSIKSFKNFLFTSALTIDSLKLGGINAGNLTLNTKQEEENIISADADLQGYGNDVKLNGTYNSASGNTDMELNIQQFNVNNAAPFTKEYLADLDGRINGKLSIKGTLDKPEVRGNIKLDSVMAVYKAYNSFASIPSSEIIFDETGIKLQGFSFSDSAGSKGTLTGYINTSNYRNYQFDIKVKASNLQAVGYKKFPEQTVYGPARADVNISLTGTEKKFFIDGGVTLAEKSSLTYVYVPNDDVIQGEGLIEFFDPLHPEDSTAKKNKPVVAASSYGMSMNVKATPSSTVVIMMDEVTGDHLKLKGNAELNVTKEPGGQMYLSGRYTLDEGTYDLSILQLIRKEFLIQKGSSITWSGDPLKADMDITALYKTKTTAAELLTDVQASSGASKQKMNFEVYLKLEDELLKPSISFQLDMPESDKQLFDGMVYNRIKQINSIPAELNKQVMGLLAINHFIADNPFSSLSSGTSSNFENSMYATAGELLTRQVSNLLGSAVKDVDISLGLEATEDYTGGEVKKNTNLNVDLSKSFADNRLSVYVGSAFALEGENQNRNAVAGLAGNVILEYLLTKDGKYRVKGFRTTENDLTLQAMVVKTGASFVIVFEFNKAKQIFKVKPQKK